MLKIKMVEGPSVGQEFDIPAEGTVVLGRRSNCNVQVADPKASRVHSEITSGAGRLYVRDMGSRNGTLINGRRLEPETPEPLEAGDRITIGDTVYTITDIGAKEIPTIEIPGYEVIDTIGRGGMGTVFKARQKSMDRIVAVKVLHQDLCKDANFINRFVHEARAAGRLSHPNIIHVFDVDKMDSVYYFTMEYVDGGNIKRAIKEKGSIPAPDAGKVILQAARALSYAHSQGVIHRDVKPENLMLTRDGQVKLADLGIARTFEETDAKGEKASKVYGTPHYMAPEQALGKVVDGRADIYSLGATFYHMLTGRTPFTGASVTEVLKAHVQEALPPITEYAPNVPEGICHVCERMMAKKPEKRYQTMDEVVADIEKALKDQSARIAAPDADESSVIPAASPQAVEFKKRRAYRQKPAWKKAVSTSVTVIFFAILFVATYFVVTQFVLTGSKTKPTVNKNEELRAKAEKALENADAAMEAGNLMGALDIYNEISYKYPEFPDLTEKVLNRIEKVKTVIAEKRRSDAEAALQEASTFYNQNPDQAEKAKEMFEEIQKKWEETPAAVIAKLKAKEIEDNLTKFQGETQDREYKKAVAEASSLVAKRDYDGAVQKLREFAARYAGANAGNDATAEVNRLEKEVEEIYNTAKKEAVQRVEKKAYGLAIAVLDQFIKVYGSAKWRGEAGKYKGQIQQEAMKTFQEACREPNAMVGQFRFEEALAKFQILATQYEGTQWGVFTRMRMQSIQAQADLHGEVIHQIKMLAKKGESPRLPFELKNFPHIKFRIVDADVKQIFLEGEAEPKFRQPFNWVDFTPRQILDIYKLFIPNPTQEQNSWLGYFCQERDLVDDAEKYFNKAGQ